MRILAKVVTAAIAVAAISGAAFWFATIPRKLDAAVVAQTGAGDPRRGERIFRAGGCSSCHARPGSEGEAKLVLTGGVELKTQFGTFVAPNISQDKTDGIGGWSPEDFANAMLKGVSPEGEHLYPAFPYASYARMTPADVGDLHAYMKTLTPVSGRAPDHRLSFPFTIRRGLGLWKLLYLSDRPVVALPADASDAVKLGQYLVEGPGHCGECHTPRSAVGGTDKARWLAGAPAAEGGGVVPNITSGEGGIGEWSETDIAYYLESGFTPDFDSVGGAMTDVQRNIARLPPEDRAAIAAYLKAIPPRANGYPARK